MVHWAGFYTTQPFFNNAFDRKSARLLSFSYQIR